MNDRFNKDFLVERCRELTDQEIINNHRYAIWQSKDGNFWYTTFPDSSKSRGVRQVRRRSREELHKAILDWYKGDEEERKSKFQKQKEAEEKLIREQLSIDSSTLKEIDVFDVKPGMYMISPIGNIYSLSTKQWKVPQLNDETDTYVGQYYVPLVSTSGKQKRYSVARLVMAVFNGMPPEDMNDPTVDHIDMMPLNNYFRNLRWLERGVNSSARANRGIGETNSRAVLTSEDVCKICNLLVKKKATVEEISEMFGISELGVRSIIDKKIWQYITVWFDFN